MEQKERIPSYFNEELKSKDLIYLERQALDPAVAYVKLERNRNNEEEKHKQLMLKLDQQYQDYLKQ